MDLIHRKEKYNEYLKKIEKAKSDDEGDYKFYEALETRADLILKDLREQSDKLEMNLAIALVAVPIILLNILSFIKDGFNAMMIPLILVVIYLIYYRIKLLSAARKVKEYRIDNRDKVADKDINWLKKKIEYIIHGMEVKLTRLRLNKMYYIVFFPIFLVVLAEYFFSTIPFGNRFISFFVAFLVGGLFWHYFFNTEIEELEDTQDDLERKMRLLE